MNNEQIDTEFNAFFEFPTADKTQVSSVSCKLFAKAIVDAVITSQAQQDHIRNATKMMQGCKECDGQTYMHSPTGEYLGECPFCAKEQEPYAYDVPTEDGTELAYAIYYTKYHNPLPEGAIPLYLQSQAQQEPVRPWICPDFMLPPRSDEVLVYPMPNNVAHTAFHDGECWRVTEYENNYGYSLVALPDGFIKGWMPLPPAPEGDKP